MTAKKFRHQELKLATPGWSSNIVGYIIELETLRDKRLLPKNIDIFWELKSLFQQLENWASARIEGNQTELIDALDPTVSEEVKQTADYKELRNLSDAIRFIDSYCSDKGSIVSNPN